MGAWLVANLHLSAILGCLYALFGAALLRQFAQNTSPVSAHRGRLTVLKPLYGAEPELEANLTSFCKQNYGGTPADFWRSEPRPIPPSVVERLTSAFPSATSSLCVDSQPHGANRKVSNLINMLARASHEIVVVSDSDIGLSRNIFESVISTLLAPGVGLVTCLYCGFPLQWDLVPPRCRRPSTAIFCRTRLSA